MGESGNGWRRMDNCWERVEKNQFVGESERVLDFSLSLVRGENGSR